MEDMGSNIIILSVLLIFSALFSGSETAFFSLTKIHIKKLEKENSSVTKRINKLLKKTKQLLITILLGNTLVNIAATSIATLYFLRISAGFSPTAKSLIMTLLVIIMTVLLLFFGEIIPKLYALSSPIKFAGFTSYLLIVVRFIFYPVIVTLEWFISKISKIKETQNANVLGLSHEDIRNMVQSESNKHPFEENEKRIIDSIFRFPSTEVKEIMIPRVDIKGIEISATILEAKKTIVNSGHSRIPVYKKTIDDILGVIHAKDFILYPEKSSLHNLQRQVMFIPENMKIQNLLTQFQNKKKQIAIVVDEYGGTSGLVTLEDILEELVGEIMDEYDEEHHKITKLNKDNYLVSGMIQISELNRDFDLNLDENFDNLAELLYAELNHIPHKNEKYVHEGTVEFVISQLKKQRINFVKMKILDTSKEDK